jgi:hypothetical protein
MIASNFVIPNRLSFRTTPAEDTKMRFMVIVEASKNSEAGVLPSKQLLADMGKFNGELTKAGVMLAQGAGAVYSNRLTRSVT